MWRAQTSRQGKKLLQTAKRRFATESAPKNASPPLPPSMQPPPKSGGRAFLKFLGVSIPLGAAGLLGYAWYDPEFRKQLESVPFTKELLDSVLPQSQPIPEIPKPQKPVLAPALDNVVQDIPVTPAPPLEKPKAREAFQTGFIKIAHCTDGNSQVAQDASKNSGNKYRKKKKNKSNDAYMSYIKGTTSKNDGTAACSAQAESTKSQEQAAPAKEDNLDITKKMLNENVSEGLDDLLCDPNSSVLDKAPTAVSYQGHTSYEQCVSRVMKEVPVLEKRQEQTAPEATSKKQTSKKPDPAEVQTEVKRQAEEEKADNAALEVVIHKLLTNSQHLTEQAIKAQLSVADTTRNHTKLLRQAMDDTADILHKDTQWEAVTVAFQEREQAVARSNELVAESKRCIEKLRDVLAESKLSKVTKNNPAIFPATKHVAELTKELSTANSQVRQAESDAKVMLKYKDLVDKGRKQFQKELESLFPDVKVGRTSRKLTEEELNGLIAHAHRRIEQLQKQIAEQLAMEQQRLNTALDMQKQENSSLTAESVSDERVRLMNEFETEKQKLELDFLVQQENEVRKQLARQAAAHSDHLKDVLAVQSEQFSKDFDRQLNTKLLEEREKFQTEVSSWISRLKGIEAAIDARATSEQLARSAQDLWLACIAFNSSIHFGADDDDSVKPLMKEMETILNAGNKHPFVEHVAQTIPKTALERGVYTEDGLRERFTKVSTVCRRLGLLNDANRSLYRYLISYLHSFFVFDNIKAFSENDLVAVDDFDNFDLVAHAQYWMDRGNLEMALRYMNQLRGEAYVAASDWIKETKLLLETRQAASTLTAYASATGLANTF